MHNGQADRGLATTAVRTGCIAVLEKVHATPREVSRPRTSGTGLAILAPTADALVS